MRSPDLRYSIFVGSVLMPQDVRDRTFPDLL
jgi:hypothetical protein